jgi:molybdopterin molybdotransferase
MINSEIDEGTDYIGYKQALSLILVATNPVKTENISVFSGMGYVCAEDTFACVDSPTGDISLKDGFAVKANDVVNVSPQNPVMLNLIGSCVAGGSFGGCLEEGQAMKVCSGSLLPAGADAVVSSEFGDEVVSGVRIKASAAAGRNVVDTGEDVKTGDLILKQGEVLLPATLGLAAAAGISHLKVFSKPRVALIAIGDEVVIPGKPINKGQIYASNLVNIAAWLSSFGIQYTLAATHDDVESIKNDLIKYSAETDVIITSGGAWKSERDLVRKALDGLNFEKVFSHVRMGPGKGVSFGIWNEKPVFCLPGGPVSNEIAFLQLALPGLLRLAGFTKSPLHSVSARLTQDIVGRHPAWTEFYRAKLFQGQDRYTSVIPYTGAKRLHSMINYLCLIRKPEGVETLYRGQILNVRILIPNFVSLTTIDL